MHEPERPLQGVLAEEGLLLIGADIIGVVQACHRSEVEPLLLQALRTGPLEMMPVDALKSRSEQSERCQRQAVKSDVKTYK